MEGLTSTFAKKLNLGAHRRAVVIGAPEAVVADLATVEGLALLTEVPADGVGFALVFIDGRAALDRWSAALAAAARGDAVLWFAYRKRVGRGPQPEVHRDAGWDAVGAAGWEPVRQVAIDEVWSALRFRRVEHIASFTRSDTMAISEAGRTRAGGR